MEPTIKDGQIVWVNLWSYLLTKPKKGEVVLFNKSGEHLVKRISEIQGKTLLLTGDNTHDSLDSRNFGPIHQNQILGKIVL